MPARKSAYHRICTELRSEIATAACKGFGFYVYTLADQYGVFYVGKGTKDRVFEHSKLAHSDRNREKQARIRSAGAGLQYGVVAFFSDSGSALSLETEMIRAQRDALANIAPGCRDGRQIVIEEAKELLSRVPSFELTPFAKHQKGRGIYERLRAEIIKQINDPAPRTITVNTATREVTYGW